MRLPFTPQLSTKDGIANSNARMSNVLKESDEGKDLAVVRPALVQVGTSVGNGKGIVNFNDKLLSIYGSTLKAWLDNLYQSTVALCPTGAAYGQLSVAYNGSRWVMVAENTMAYSDDGLTWTSYALPSTSSPYSWSSVAWGNGKFVMVSSGDFATSTDGIAWSVTDWAGSYLSASVGITYVAGRFVAVSNYGDLVASSANGVSWTYSSSIGNYGWTRPVGNSSAVVVTAAFNNITRYSLDGGLTWANGTLSYPNVYVVGQAVLGERICLLTSEGDALHSDDGVNWTGNAYLPGPAGWVCGVSAGQFVALGYNAYGDYTFTVLSSYDAINWTDTGLVLNEIYDMIGADGDGNKIVAYDQNDRLVLIDLQTPIAVEAATITGDFFDFAQSTL